MRSPFARLEGWSFPTRILHHELGSSKTIDAALFRLLAQG
jgi:hypothetical protein